MVYPGVFDKPDAGLLGTKSSHPVNKKAEGNFTIFGLIFFFSRRKPTFNGDFFLTKRYGFQFRKHLNHGDFSKNSIMGPNSLEKSKLETSHLFLSDETPPMCWSLGRLSGREFSHLLGPDWVFFHLKNLRSDHETEWVCRFSWVLYFQKKTG